MKTESVVDRPQRVVKLVAENVKRIKAVSIDTKGKPVVIIGGRNGQGKSSAIDVIRFVMGGKAAIDGKPIRDGESEASGTIHLDDLTVERTFRIRDDGTEATSLTVRDASGANLKSPQSILERLYGVLGFDPMAWDRMSPAEQIAVLEKAAGLDFSEIDKARGIAYEQRREANTAVKLLRARLPDSPADVLEDAPTLVAATARARDIERANRAIRDNSEAIAAKAAEQKAIGDRIEGLSAEVAKLQAQSRLTDAQSVALADGAATLGDPIDPAEADEWLAEARAAEALSGEIRKYNEALVEIQGAEATAAEEDAKIKMLDGAKKTALAQAKLPVKGLAWEDKIVTYKGIPYPQCSSSDRIKITLGMGAKMNPDMPVICVREAGLLDEDNFVLVCQFAEQHGLQVFLEVPGDREGAVIIEDGSVVDDGEGKP